LLCSTPQVTADSIWQDFLSWLAGLWSDPGFNQTVVIPIMEAKFAEILQSATATAESTDALEANINQQTKELADVVKRIDAILATLAEPYPPPGTDPAMLKAELEALRPHAEALEKSLDSMETTTKPPLMVLDKVLGYQDGRLYIPTNKPPADPCPQTDPDSWKETNYKRFAE